MISLIFVPLMTLLLTSDDVEGMEAVELGWFLQLADGGPFFHHVTDPRLQQEADQLDMYMTRHDEELERYAEPMRVNDHVYRVLEMYQSTVNLTHPDKECWGNNNYSAGLASRLRVSAHIVDTCLSFAPREDRETLRRTLTETRRKLQSLDQQFGFIDQVCSPKFLSHFKGEATHLCRNNLHFNLRKIDEILSADKYVLRKMYNRSLNRMKLYVKSCVKRGTAVQVVTIWKTLEGEWAWRVKECRNDAETFKLIELKDILGETRTRVNSTTFSDTNRTVVRDTVGSRYVSAGKYEECPASGCPPGKGCLKCTIYHPPDLFFIFFTPSQICYPCNETLPDKSNTVCRFLEGECTN